MCGTRRPYSDGGAPSSLPMTTASPSSAAMTPSNEFDLNDLLAAGRSLTTSASMRAPSRLSQITRNDTSTTNIGGSTPMDTNTGGRGGGRHGHARGRGGRQSRGGDDSHGQQIPGFEGRRLLSAADAERERPSRGRRGGGRGNRGAPPTTTTLASDADTKYGMESKGAELSMNENDNDGSDDTHDNERAQRGARGSRNARDTIGTWQMQRPSVRAGTHATSTTGADNDSDSDDDDEGAAIIAREKDRKRRILMAQIAESKNDDNKGGSDYYDGYHEPDLFADESIRDDDITATFDEKDGDNDDNKDDTWNGFKGYSLSCIRPPPGAAGRITISSSKSPVRVLCVAEKPSIAASIAQYCSLNGNCRTRSSRPPVHEYEADFMGQSASFKITSVTGHVYETDFVSGYESWDTTDPKAMFNAGIKKKGSRICA
jgi:hypothetical protein